MSDISRTTCECGEPIRLVPTRGTADGNTVVRWLHDSDQLMGVPHKATPR